jgi:CO/xanthine dehydrogenase FAD-binding subunit
VFGGGARMSDVAVGQVISATTRLSESLWRAASQQLCNMATAAGNLLTDELMALRRPEPPPVLAAELGDEGALHGAATVALDRVLDADGLAAWASVRGGASSSEAPAPMG